MRLIFIILLSLILSSCHSRNKDTKLNANQVITNFLALSSDPEAQGSILIYDLNQNQYYSNNFDWANTGQIPASTFKIPNSLIALELSIVKDESTLFKWDGEPRMFEIWQQDLSFKQAFHYSCVPCYQEIARKINTDRMNQFTNKFQYGQLDIGIENIDDFWLIGKSKINQFGQIEFLKKLYHSQLPISKSTEQVFKTLFISKKTDQYTLRAKTGLSVNDDEYNGWYVGYVEANDNAYFFATNLSPVKYNNSFNNKRKFYTIKALEQLGAINE
jgi:beta-lactamase class D